MATPYRNELDALEARHAALTEELAAVQKRTRELADLQKTEADLERELAALRDQLASIATRRSLPLLDDVRVASPCSADWDAMIGDDRVRFCAHCQKDVYNLSSLPRDEAERFLRERVAEVCVRLYRRADGTVLTADCPVGVTRKRRRNLAAAAIAAFGSGVAAAAFFPQQGKPAVTPTMGGIKAPPPEEVAMGVVAMDPEETPKPRVTLGRIPIKRDPATDTAGQGAPPRREIPLSVQPRKGANDGAKAPPTSGLPRSSK